MSVAASLITATHPTCLALLQSCTSMRQFFQIHAQMIRNFLFEDPFAASKLIEFCSVSDFGNVHYACKLFAGISHPNNFTWNTIIRGYAKSPFPIFSLRLFNQMLQSTSIPNSFTFSFVIKACSRLSAYDEGRQLHGFILKSGTDSDLFCINGLIHMYAACGKISLARRLFDTSYDKNSASWSSILSGYVNCGLIEQARQLFDDMPEKGIVSWNAMISGYCKSGNIEAARELFDRMPCRNVESWNTLIAGYAKCNLLHLSRNLFDEMPTRNIVSWSTMITAYAQGARPYEALVLFVKMTNAKVTTNWAALVSALSACAQLGALDQGKRIHLFVDQSKMKVDSIIGTALIDMYAKCGSLENAIRVFNVLASKDVFSWTAMIGGLALNGKGKKALELFGQMERSGVRPNEVTFIGVLCACCHGGWVELGRKYFNSMTTRYGIEPRIEHYGCMVDTLGRAGLFEEAVSFIEDIPMKTNPILWGALLGACWIHGNAKLGEHVGDHLVNLEPDDAGVYVLLSNIYATVGRWDDARKMRVLMKSKGVQKSPGCSSIEVHGMIHVFYVGDRSHHRAGEIYRMLEMITSRLRNAGYTPNTSPALFDIEDEEKENVVLYHSEKLAVAFGLISIEECLPIRIVKNLRVCGDCHTVMKFVSKLFNREIVLRDRNVFHYFKDGSCSCKDYW